MCDVCVAENALAMTDCKKNTCASFQRGMEIRWDFGPDLTAEQHKPEAPLSKLLKTRLPLSKKLRKKIKGKLANRCNLAKPMLFVRARGKSAEFKKAEYQIRLPYERWPKKWTPTKDLAGSMGVYGLHVKWECVPKEVQNWILRKRKMPTEGELRAINAKRRKALEKKEGKKRKPTFSIPVKVDGKTIIKTLTPKEVKEWSAQQKKEAQKWRNSVKGKREREGARRRHKVEVDQQRVAWTP